MEALRYSQLDDRSKLQFNFLSAGLSNYLPEIDGKLHFQIYKSLLDNLATAYSDITDKSRLADIKIKEPHSDYFKEIVKSGPLLIVTFHTGSYRLLNFLLAKWNIPISILLNQIALKEQGPIYSKLSKEISGTETQLELIDSDSPRSAINLLKAIKDKRLIIIYIDGNTGMGDRASENKNSILVNFLNGRLYVRGGIGYLSYKTQTPVLPVLAHFDDDGSNIIECFPVIRPNAEGTKEDYEYEAMQKVYDNAASVIGKYPNQWEGWFYIHKSAVINNTDEEIDLQEKDLSWYKPKDFGVFRMGKDNYLIDKKHYSFQQISDNLYDKLDKLDVFS